MVGAKPKGQDFDVFTAFCKRIAAEIAQQVQLNPSNRSTNWRLSIPGIVISSVSSAQNPAEERSKSPERDGTSTQDHPSHEILPHPVESGHQADRTSE